jgi:hypothetical protein
LRIVLLRDDGPHAATDGRSRESASTSSIRTGPRLTGDGNHALGNVDLLRHDLVEQRPTGPGHLGDDVEVVLVAFVHELVLVLAIDVDADKALSVLVPGAADEPPRALCSRDKRVVGVRLGPGAKVRPAAVLGRVSLIEAGALGRRQAADRVARVVGSQAARRPHGVRGWGGEAVARRSRRREGANARRSLAKRNVLRGRRAVILDREARLRVGRWQRRITLGARHKMLPCCGPLARLGSPDAALLLDPERERPLGWRPLVLLVVHVLVPVSELEDRVAIVGVEFAACRARVGEVGKIDVAVDAGRRAERVG